ncbi:hypothetical protein HKD37_07G019631 [Glycine soja]
MGVNDGDKSKRQKVLSSQDVTSLKELGRLMGPLQRQAFRKVYGKILDLAAAEVFTEAVVSLAQYYDQPLRCFTFGDFQMVPTIEEFEEILGCPLGGRKPYLFSGFLPSLSKIAAVVGGSAKELDRTKQTQNGVVGLPRKYLEGKARDMASQEKWGPFADILALLIFGVVLFPNIDGLVDLAAIDTFLAYHHSKESPVVAILADLFDTFDRRCEKNSTRIVCCLPALYVWLISHLFRQDTRHPCPLQSYRSCAEKRKSRLGPTFGWDRGQRDQLVSSLEGRQGRSSFLLGYHMKGAPTEESLSPCLVRDLGAQGLKVIQRIHKAWRNPLKKDKELRGIRNGVIGGYHGWLRIHARGLDWLSKLKVIDEENFEAPEEDEEGRQDSPRRSSSQLLHTSGRSAPSYKRKTRPLQKPLNKKPKGPARRNMAERNSEEHCGVLRREERDRSRVHGMILKEELVTCARSKRSLAQHLEATEQSMLAIIGQYKEELNHSMAHEQKLVEDFAQVYAEKEARGRVIDALHQEAAMWMDRFTLTLNGSQDLPRLLAKAKAMAEVCTAPEEIHGLINCSNFADLVFAGERIESGLRKGKFEYAANMAPNNNRRAPVVGARKKEGDAHAVTTAPTWMKAPQNIQSSYQPNPPNFLIRAGNSLPNQVKGPPAAERTPAQRTAPAAPRPVNNTAPGVTYKYAQHPKDNFPPIPMAYSELWPSLLENHLVVAIPGKVLQSPYPKWYDPGAKCVYHSGVSGHNIDSCIPFKYKVQHLISAGWLSFQEEGPNVKTNPLASHGGTSMNAVKEDEPPRTKRLGEVATSRRFIYQSLQAACMVSSGGGERDECLFHLGESHDMETCPAVEELLQRLMDCGQLEVSIEEGGGGGGRTTSLHAVGREEGSSNPQGPKTGSTPIYPRAAPKPTPFAYQSNKAVPWKYTPPASSERVATEVDPLSAKVTNIIGLSGVTRSGRVFASPHPAELPSKGKAPMVKEPTDIATPSKEVDPPVGRGAEKKEGLQGKTVTLEEAHEFLRLIQQSEFKVVEQLNKTPARISLLELLINFEPHRALLMKVLNDAHCFTSAGMVSEEEVAAIEEEFPQDPPSFVQPCHLDSQVGNWRVISQSEVYTADSICEGRFFEEPNNEESSQVTVRSQDKLTAEINQGTWGQMQVGIGSRPIDRCPFPALNK